MAVALGLSNGAVHLLRADVPKSKVAAPVPAAQLRDAGSAAGSAAGGSGSGITALHFVPAPSAAAGAEAGGSSTAHTGRRGETAAAPGLHLFAVGAARLAAFDARTGRRLLDDECGAAPGCSAVSCKGELMLAGPEAVYFYTGGWGAGWWWRVYCARQWRQCCSGTLPLNRNEPCSALPPCSRGGPQGGVCAARREAGGGGSPPLPGGGHCRRCCRGAWPGAGSVLTCMCSARPPAKRLRANCAGV